MCCPIKVCHITCILLNQTYCILSALWQYHHTYGFGYQLISMFQIASESGENREQFKGLCVINARTHKTDLFFFVDSATGLMPLRTLGPNAACILQAKNSQMSLILAVDECLYMGQVTRQQIDCSGRLNGAPYLLLASRTDKLRTSPTTRCQMCLVEGQPRGLTKMT